MDSILEAIMAALKDQTGADLLGYAGAWGVSPMVAHMYIQFTKNTRREMSKDKLPAWQLRGMASITSLLMALFFANRLAGWPMDRALDHAIAVAVCYPALMFVYMSRIRKYDPDMAKDLGGDAATELRMVKNDDKH